MTDCEDIEFFSAANLKDVSAIKKNWIGKKFYCGESVEEVSNNMTQNISYQLLDIRITGPLFRVIVAGEFPEGNFPYEVTCEWIAGPRNKE